MVYCMQKSKLLLLTGLIYFSSLTTIDIPGQPNSLSGIKLKEKFKSVPNIQYSESIEEAIKSITFEDNDVLIITGSLYLAGEVLNLN